VTTSKAAVRLTLIVLNNFCVTNFKLAFLNSNEPTVWFLSAFVRNIEEARRDLIKCATLVTVIAL
jgi:hypothetical protein